MFDKISGIYCIENLINGKKYIGQARNINRRIKAQLNELEKGVSKRKFLQEEWLIYGKDNFKIYQICECEDNADVLDLMETKYIHDWETHISKNGYNVSFGGRSSFKGLHHTEENKKLFRERQTGKKASEESKRKNRESNLGEKNGFYGKHHTDETKEKMKNNHADVLGENNPAYGTHYGQGKKPNKNPSSKYAGVSRRGNRWRSRIYYLGEEINLGNYDTEKEAAEAYNKKAIEIYGKSAILNIVE